MILNRKTKLKINDPSFTYLFLIELLLILSFLLGWNGRNWLACLLSLLSLPVELFHSFAY